MRYQRLHDIRLANHALQEKAGVSLIATTQPDAFFGVLARQADHGGVQSEDTRSEELSLRNALSTDIAAAVFAYSLSIAFHLSRFLPL